MLYPLRPLIQLNYPLPYYCCVGLCRLVNHVLASFLIDCVVHCHTKAANGPAGRESCQREKPEQLFCLCTFGCFCMLINKTLSKTGLNLFLHAASSALSEENTIFHGAFELCIITVITTTRNNIWEFFIVINDS